MIMWKKIRWYIAGGILLAVAILLVISALKTVVESSGVDTKVEKRIVMTPAVLDSIHSIKQWELASVPVKTVVDTVEMRWMGLVKRTVSKKYEGCLSVGINLQSMPALRYRVSGDTISLVIPDVCVLDSNFIDETKTEILRSDNDDFEARPDVRKAMAERAKQRMLAEGLSPVTISECRHRAEKEVSERLKQIGYTEVEIRFEK